MDQLQFLYLHPNPSGVAGVEPGNVQGMVLNAITALNGVGCHLVAMNGIHAGTTKGGHNCERDGTNTQQTMDTIRTWRAMCDRGESQRHIQRLYLVDIRGEFGPAEQ